MIEKLSIKNFQNHKAMVVEFSKRITTITGPSDAGKSAALRSLYWLMANKPRGDYFIQEGQTLCTVSAVIDGHKVGRRRGKSINEYHFDKTSFKAFSSDVPEQIADALNIDPELNFQLQHDAPFWVGLSPAEVARQLNSIVDLSSIDQVTKELTQRARKLKSKEETLSEQLLDTADRLQHYEGLEEVAELHDTYEVNKTASEEKQASAAALSEVVRLFEHNKTALELHKKTAGETKRIRLSWERIVNLQKIIKELSILMKRIEWTEKLVAMEPPNSKSAEEAFEKATFFKPKVKQLKALIDRLRMQGQELQKHSKAAEDAQKWLEDNQLVLCPECGRPL